MPLFFMKRKKIAFMFLLCFSGFLISCGHVPEHASKSPSEIHVDDIERETTNLFGEWVSDGKICYSPIPMLDGIVIYRMEGADHHLVPNCDNLLCKHDNPSCSAYVGGQTGMGELHRDGDQVYFVGNTVYQIEKNKKTPVGNLPQRYGPDVLFYPYIAYFEEQDTLVVKNLETEQEIQRFDNITGYTQGNFFYKDSLYYVTAEFQLVRLDLDTGEKEILEKKGATRACVYHDQIYYVKVPENESDANSLIRMNPETGEKEELVQGVFYYNMLDDWLYYSTYPGRKYYRCRMDGTEEMEIPIEEGIQAGAIWTLPELGEVIVDLDDYYTAYFVDVKNGSIDFDHPICKPHEEG